MRAHSGKIPEGYQTTMVRWENKEVSDYGHGSVIKDGSWRDCSKPGWRVGSKRQQGSKAHDWHEWMKGYDECSVRILVHFQDQRQS